MDTWNNHRKNTDDHLGKSYEVQVVKIGRIVMQNIKHIRNTSVTIKKSLRDLIARSRTQTLVTF